jgi:hypothetical protein
MDSQLENQLRSLEGTTAPQQPHGRGGLQERLRKVRPSDGAGLPEPGEGEPPRSMLDENTAALRTLMKTMPRRLRRGVPQTIDVQITPELLAALFQGAAGPSDLARAVSLILYSRGAGVAVETLAPQTQWLFDRPSFIETERFGRWRWRLTGTKGGRHKLQFAVSCRSLDQHGMSGDIALPHQVIDVRVGGRFGRAAGKLLLWLALIAAGAGLALLALKFGHLKLW